jgi:hypothetical protein
MRLSDIYKPIGNHYMLIGDIIGPGQYDLPKLTGTKNMVSTLSNFPAFTMSSKIDSNKKVVISKKHSIEQLGRDSPGVGAYQYDYEKLQRKFLANGNGGNNYSFGFGTRFFDFR